MSGKRVALRQLERIYDQIPEVECKGLCTAFCGAIFMTELEHDRIVERTGRPLGKVDARLTCPLLSIEGRCTVYDIRPFICRLWGAEEKLRCPHGCQPKEGVLSHEMGGRLADQVKAVGGARVANF